MPHIAIDYSANLEDADIGGLCEALRATAASLDIFPELGVRVRAFRADHATVADGDPENGYVDISVRLREGRPLDRKQAAAKALFEAAKAHLGPVLATRPVLLSLEMRDIDADLAPKLNTLRERLESA